MQGRAGDSSSFKLVMLTLKGWLILVLGWVCYTPCLVLLSAPPSDLIRYVGGLAAAVSFIGFVVIAAVRFSKPITMLTPFTPFAVLARNVAVVNSPLVAAVPKSKPRTNRKSATKSSRPSRHGRRVLQGGRITATAATDDDVMGVAPTAASGGVGSGRLASRPAPHSGVLSPSGDYRTSSVRGVALTSTSPPTAVPLSPLTARYPRGNVTKWSSTRKDRSAVIPTAPQLDDSEESGDDAPAVAVDLSLALRESVFQRRDVWHIAALTTAMVVCEAPVFCAASFVVWVVAVVPALGTMWTILCECKVAFFPRRVVDSASSRPSS